MACSITTLALALRRTDVGDGGRRAGLHQRVDAPRQLMTDAGGEPRLLERRDRHPSCSTVTDVDRMHFAIGGPDHARLQGPGLFAFLQFAGHHKRRLARGAGAHPSAAPPRGYCRSWRGRRSAGRSRRPPSRRPRGRRRNGDRHHGDGRRRWLEQAGSEDRRGDGDRAEDPRRRRAAQGCAGRKCAMLLRARPPARRRQQVRRARRERSACADRLGRDAFETSASNR